MILRRCSACAVRVSNKIAHNFHNKRAIFVKLNAQTEQHKLINANAAELPERKFLAVSSKSDTEHLRKAVQNILISRVVGTEGHRQVRDYIVQSLTDLKWSVELDTFHDTVPKLGKLQFHNIIATLNPKAEQFLVLACHYDSKYMPDIEFVGASDSAVPCAMLINLAKVLETELLKYRETSLSLMLIFFDGEEAFDTWNAHDSIYGARHLAKKWEDSGFLERLKMLVLLDLLGMPDPKFYSFSEHTEGWYLRLLAIEEQLASIGKFANYASSGLTHYQPERYFQPNSLRGSSVEDDHIPFMQRHVPVIHLIPLPFPHVWHTKDDNESNIDYATTENLSLILRIFTLEFLFSHTSSKFNDSNHS